jgi:4-hydroxy-3-methylbut-2-en-1-yl diphosphate synthase IspG/GcpE
MDFPIHKVRIKPGNIGERRKVEEVLSKARGQWAFPYESA